MEIIVVSIGTLSKNPLWGERTAVRTSHATTTLIQEGDQRLLVDPSLPPAILEQRLFERSGLKPSAITHVFLTNWRPVHRRALELFGNAKWHMHEPEIQFAGGSLDAAERRNEAGDNPDPEVKRMLQQERQWLERIEPAPDELFEDVDIFPLPGYSPGQCGLLVTSPATAVVVAGDAVPTSGHFLAGQVLGDSQDLQQAKESLAEMYEIADLIVPGHDNIFLNPRRTGL